MPRSTIANRRAIWLDANTQLRDYTSSAISATTAETAIALAATKLEDFKAVVDVAAYTSYSSGTAEWLIEIQVSATSGGTYTTVGSFTPVGTANRFDVPLSGEWIEDKLSTAAYIRVKATKTGSPGNLTYGAILTPCC